MSRRACEICGYSFELVRADGVCNTCMNRDDQNIPTTQKPLQS